MHLENQGQYTEIIHAYDVVRCSVVIGTKNLHQMQDCIYVIRISYVSLPFVLSHANDSTLRSNLAWLFVDLEFLRYIWYWKDTKGLGLHCTSNSIRCTFYKYYLVLRVCHSIVPRDEWHV